ncbi:phage head closure protein [Falsochrobactrum sp. TDYN1]|uniref:Phage head closure protein n=1 Tax=Falsochrobactrum tianjinense TaxID=2706015 RepID=A0A949PPE7_9HYPH|nr:phage head closure protein [Falsochrobactrum sp. TDYN1]MBV2144407.1 phage head closure protein [Falsochrobactrum sp. TDYN1]
MRAGKLDRFITIERGEETADEYGGVSFAWSKFADLRAQIVQASTEEYIRAFGARDETVIIFRTRYLDGITNADRIAYAGGYYNIKELKEIGRREGFEIRCVRQA